MSFAKNLERKPSIFTSSKRKKNRKGGIVLNRAKHLVFMVILVVTFGSLAIASGYDDCQKAIRGQVRQNNRSVEKVVFHADSEKSVSKSDTETVYTGEGEFQRHTGKWESFSYTCSYNPKNATLNQAHYSVKVADPGSPVPALKDFVGARAGQAEGDLQRHGYRWVKKDGAFSYWVEESTKNCVSIKTEDGRYTAIVYAMQVDCNQ
jgi:hypothetical protein